MIALLTGAILGVVSGMRHALEPDHLAAVTTLVAGQTNRRTTLRFATFWGIGHACMLFMVGGALFLFRARLPDTVADIFELIVAAMLVSLGVRGVILARRSRSHEHRRNAKVRISKLPFFVGVVHGLAGSGALVTLAIAKLPTLAEGMLFMALYATGTIAGMSALGGALGFPLARLAKEPRVVPILVASSAIFSVGLGIWWALPIVSRM